MVVSDGPSLSVRHRTVLMEESGLSEAVLVARGYRSLSIDQVADLVQSGLFPSWLLERTDGWLAIPIYRPDGQHHCDIIRIDEYVANAENPDKPFRSPKYLWPMGVRSALDVHPASLPYVADPSVVLVITEGVKKGDAILSRTRLLSDTRAIGAVSDGSPPLCVVSINGCWGWKSSPISTGATVGSPDWGDVVLDGRKIIVIPDSDYRTNPGVHRGWNECATYVAGKTRSSEKEAQVLVAVPPGKGLGKQGADDYLLDHTLDDLFSRAEHHRLVSPLRVITDLNIRWAGELLDQAEDTVPTLVKNMFAEDSVNVLAGHSQTFKTWLAMILGLDAAAGLNWHDHPDLPIVVPRTKMLYVNKEMSEKVFGVRLKNLARHERYEGCGDELRQAIAHTDEARIDFKNPDLVDILTDKIGEFGFRYCVLDTFSMVWSGNENDSSEVGAMFMKLREITQATKVIWLILHHLVKPSKDRAGINQMFHVRGSGQIIQQCDSALLLNMGKIIDEETKEITAVHAKGRLTGELPPWVVHYVRDKETGTTAMLHQSSVSEARAQVYADSHGDQDALVDWVHATLVEQPIMREQGMRTGPLLVLLRASWPKDNPDTPSERTLRRTLKHMTDEGTLIETKNQRLGSLFNLAVQGEPLEVHDE